jgi:CubicO group peptidase (beta-lactamase class C family)
MTKPKRKTILKAFALFSLLFLVLIVLNSNGSKAIIGENKAGTIITDTDSLEKIKREINADQKAQKLAAFFNKKVKTERFNGCILVAQKGVIVYKGCSGFANLEKKIPLQISSEFQLASTSKTFTAISILQLFEQGKLALDDGVEKYIPNFPYKGVSIKSLLNHRSGLSNYVYDCEPYCQKPNLYQGKTFDNEAMLDILLKYKPQRHCPPNKKFEYCNTNYALLALIVEKASGIAFETYLQKNIFDSLQMNNTYVITSKVKPSENKTVGHFANCKIYKDCFADEVLGDKGIYSTVEDMFKYDQALYNNKLVKQQTLDMAFSGYSNEHKGIRNYGLGWRIIEDKQGKIVYHNGWWHGYNSTFYRLIEQNITVIVLSNKDNRSAYRVSEIFSIMKGGKNTSQDSDELEI